jgi:hypothetical protein
MGELPEDPVESEPLGGIGERDLHGTFVAQRWKVSIEILFFRMNIVAFFGRMLPLLLIALASMADLRAQETPIMVADQTFKVEDTHQFAYALAEGDVAKLHIQLIAGRGLRSVEFIEWPGTVLFRAHQLDTNQTKEIMIPRTGVYVLRITEAGLGKKICRFVLQRTPANAGSRRMDTRVGWDLAKQSEWQVQQRPIQTGKTTAMVRNSGQVTVPAGKMGLTNSRTAWFFTLPPNTTQWAYRVSVGQSAANARRADAQKFSELTKSGAMKMMAVQPETALAAFALGMAVEMTVSTAGEDVEYILADAVNTQRYLNAQTTYDAFIWQGAVNVDVQRRYTPLSGTFALAFRNNNWVDDISVEVDIEAVTETPVIEMETYLIAK